MGKRYLKKKRRVFTLYNFMVLACILVILGSAYFLFDLKDEVSGFIAFTKEAVGDFVDNIKKSSDEDKAKNKNTAKNEKNSSNNGNVSGNDSYVEEITEDEAKNIAVKRFTALGEQDVNAESISIKKIRRSGEEYYYITSAENTLEVKIIGGNITRINSVIVDN